VWDEWSIPSLIGVSVRRFFSGFLTFNPQSTAILRGTVSSVDFM
jgi:hypothetical protein